MSKDLIGATIAIAALTALIPASARAADPAYCQNYAQAAINQVRGALENPNCASRIRGPRWSSDMALHYNWCLTQPYPTVEAERGARSGFLRACRS